VCNTLAGLEQRYTGRGVASDQRDALQWTNIRDIFTLGYDSLIAHLRASSRLSRAPHGKPHARHRTVHRKSSSRAISDAGSANRQITRPSRRRQPVAACRSGLVCRRGIRQAESPSSGPARRPGSGSRPCGLPVIRCLDHLLDRHCQQAENGSAIEDQTATDPLERQTCFPALFCGDMRGLTGARERLDVCLRFKRIQPAAKGRLAVPPAQKP
jgi:hypothetical protein